MRKRGSWRVSLWCCSDTGYFVQLTANEVEGRRNFGEGGDEKQCRLGRDGAICWSTTDWNALTWFLNKNYSAGFCQQLFF